MTESACALVTGAAGFIGRHLVGRLARDGWSVRALDVHPMPSGFTNERVAFSLVDIRNRAAMARALVGVDTVFNLASVHLDVNASRSEFESVNVRALEELVELSRAASVRRFIQISSVGVYGHVAEPPAPEDAPLCPENDYERTKLAGEIAARKAAQEFGVDLLILRPAWVYGPGCPRTSKLVSALRKGRFFYIGKGANLRHPVHIDDCLDAMVAAARVPANVTQRVFNVAGPKWMTVEDMVRTFADAVGVRPPSLHIPRWAGLAAGWSAEKLGAITGIEPPISRRTLAFFENDNAFNIAAAQGILGYTPRVQLREGIKKLLSAAAGGVQ
jgi:nucleoside-diphosphate-sugar epimerase